MATSRKSCQESVATTLAASYAIVLLLAAAVVCRAESPMAEEPSELCRLTGHVFSQVYFVKQATCKMQDDYQKHALFLASGYFEGIHPGRNCVPCRQYIDPVTEKVVWQKQLGYVIGVLNNTDATGYVADMVTYEKILNNTPSNPFPYLFQDLSEKIAQLDSIAQGLTMRLPNTTMMHLVGKADVCSPQPSEQWPPKPEETESEDEYYYWLSVYNYGTMDALCDTLTQLHNVLLLALNEICPAHHHHLVVNTASPTTANTTAPTTTASSRDNVTTAATANDLVSTIV